MLFQILFYALSGGVLLYYVFFMLRHAIALKRLEPVQKTISVQGATIIIPVRNDSIAIRRLLSCLMDQNEVKIPIQIIVVDDHSQDNLRQAIQPYLHKVEYLLLPEDKQGKKQAIEYGIAHAKHEIIITTDADCTMQEKWLYSMLSCFENNTQLVSGPVLLEANTLFQSIQQIELMGLVGIGAGAIYLNKPNLCNGANLAYRKTAFHKVKGYEGSLHLASGDDEFLMHKIHHYFACPNAVVFCKNYQSVVFTPAQTTLRDFLEQRKRWVSKTIHYKRKGLTSQLVIIYLFYWVLLIDILLCFWKQEFIYFTILIGLAKIIAEWSIIGQMMYFFKLISIKRISVFCISQLFQVLYVVWAGLVSLRPTFTWKERKYG
ncbi:MAG: glycosyltransferase [Bacteroidia bacterium]|nr:glycosyltransferase [Bacteroidia bacterium]MDW8347675.1 glycosyltransferase [Bacteroidia bacterium]